MTLPNFLILGAQKAGTTSLFNYLGQHPEVYPSPIKETHFFDHGGVRQTYAGPVRMPGPKIKSLEEDRRVREGWHPIYHYRSRGFYHAQLSRYFDLFGHGQVSVYLYDDLSSDP